MALTSQVENNTSSPTSSSSWWLNSLDSVNSSNSLNESISNGTTSVGEEVDPAFVRFLSESRFWVQRVLLPLIVIVGVFGNAVTIVVLTRRGMRSSTNHYLTALAVADLVYLLCVFWLSLNHYPIFKDDVIASSIFAYAQPFSLWLTDATTCTSVWLTVAFTVERYIAVCHPIRGRVLCTESRAKKVIAAVYVICFSAAISTAFEWTVVEVTNSTTNITRIQSISSDLGDNETYRTVYYWFTSITFVLLPLTLLIVFNSFLIQSVRKSQQLRHEMTNGSAGCHRQREDHRAMSNEIRITVTLIAVVIMFLVCQLPTAATLIYNIFTTPSTNEEALLRGLGNIFNCLVGLNAACNFLLYCALSDKYRKTFLLTICHCFYRDTSFDCGQSDDRRATRGSPSPTIAATNRKRPAQNTADNNRLALPNRNGSARQTRVLQTRSNSSIISSDDSSRRRPEGWASSHCWPWSSRSTLNRSPSAVNTTAATATSKSGNKGRTPSIIIHIADVGGGVGSDSINCSSDQHHLGDHV